MGGGQVLEFFRRAGQRSSCGLPSGERCSTGGCEGGVRRVAEKEAKPGVVRWQATGAQGIRGVEAKPRSGKQRGSASRLGGAVGDRAK